MVFKDGTEKSPVERFLSPGFRLMVRFSREEIKAQLDQLIQVNRSSAKKKEPAKNFFRVFGDRSFQER